MIGRLKLIEQKLIGIDSAAFQNLCDIYLAFREQEFISISRTGSQLGKQKTVKGTPDTFFRLSDGSLRYVEYTTKADGLIDKIIGDIDKCLDISKTHIPIDQIHKIIICFNSRLSLVEETEIVQYASIKKVRIELIGLDWLAIEIYSKYLILAKDILGIPLDTGQLLPLQNFIDEYNNKAGNLSTPLDNVFLHRKIELSKIENDLLTNDLLIISGFPGVGKTKIALEAVNNFLLINKNYLGFAVSKKDQDISEDLKIHLQLDKDYILLIDDANRQLPNFKQILGVFKEKRKGNIKLLVTVRDYALNDVTIECIDFLHQIIYLEKFKDEEITQLISSASFGIANPKYQKRIVAIADGNARLAVMASRLAKQEEYGFLYGDGERIFELYDYYFKTFIKDFDIFGNKILIKTLGIISFFFTIDRSNKELLETILRVFEIDYYKFNEAIDELEKRELLEVKYNNARVSEQVMATYFFYVVFIKDEMLSFKTLLFTFFPLWKNRFSDTIIPSNNSFGYDNVLNRINLSLDEYLQSVYSNEEKVLEFFSLFWFYKREETLNYFHQKIQQLPEPVEPKYDSKYEKKDFWNKDKTLDFLGDLFNYYTESFIPAMELSFEFCRKTPDALPDLIKLIRERLLFDDEDHNSDFQRQVELFNLLIKNFKDKQPHYVEAFFTLSGNFLGHYYHNIKGGRNHSFTTYQYPLPFYEITQGFRRTLWATILENYENYPEEVFSLIKHFRPGYREAIIEILEFDLSILIPFIENNLDFKRFENIHFVYEFVWWLNRENLKDRGYQNLKMLFNSKEYEYFRKLDWNSLRGKQDYDFEKYDDFKKLKENDVRASFIFKSEKEFGELYSTIKEISAIEENGIGSIYESLNIIIEENFIQNPDLGFRLLKGLLINHPKDLNPLYKAIKVIANKSEDWALNLWNLIKGWQHQSKLYWELNFFNSLPIELASEFYKNELLTTINSINFGCYIQFESFDKFRVVDKDIILKILIKVIEKIEKMDLKINLSIDFFEKYSISLSDNFDILSKAYIQQEKIHNHFDYNRKGLNILTQINSSFLLEYISIFYNEKKRSNVDTHNNLSFVWDLDNCDFLMEEASTLIIQNSIFFGILEHPLNIFFYNLSESQKIKAKTFILNYLDKYSNDIHKMNAIVDLLRHTMKDFFDESLIKYLSINQSVEDFKKIYWRGNGGTYSGNVIIGDIQAKDWERIYAVVEKANDQLNLIPIKAYIKKQIEYQLERGELERKGKFINPEAW